jgi:5-methylcytosine-specific restriction endonuclease McrA
MTEPDLVPIDTEILLPGQVGGSRSPEWEKARRAYAIANPSCAACGGRKMIQVHHCKPFHLHPELELDPKNFITLCEDPERLCHHRVGHSWDWKAYNPLVRGDATIELLRVLKRKYE